jgi:tRNA threonylcarbamoyladenosine biosynthesis protein TsaE
MRLGAALAPWLEPGDVIALEGPLGAGKTRFVAGLAHGLDVKARVRSPTFTLVNEYHGRIALLHVDLYRLERREVASLALEERVESAVLIVEWAEKLPGTLLDAALEVRITPGNGDTRTLEARGAYARAAVLLERWQQALAPGAA